MVNFKVIRNMILRGNMGYEPTVANVHTEKKNKCKRKGGLYLYSPNRKIRYTEFHFFKRRRLGDNSPSLLGTNRGGLVGERVVVIALPSMSGDHNSCFLSHVQ